MRIGPHSLKVFISLFVFLVFNFTSVWAFPMPEGKFAVGRTSLQWVDTDRQELFSGKTGRNRELMVTIWYPAAENNKPAAGYMPEPDRKAVDSPSAVRKLKVTAREGVTIANSDEPYPILVFSPGLGTTRYSYTAFVEEMASHGYVVVAVDHPYTQSGSVAFPDGRIANLIKLNVNDSRDKLDLVCETSTQDIIFTINQLTRLHDDPQNMFYHNLDLSKIGAFGHSAGGCRVAEAACRDTRIKAIVDLDGGLSGDRLDKGLNIPALFMFSKQVYETNFDEKVLEKYCKQYLPPKYVDKTMQDSRIAAEQMKKSALTDGAIIIIKGMNHMNFSDEPSYSWWYRLGPDVGKINVDRGYKIVNAYMLAFFDSHLKGVNTELIRGESKDYPEVTFIR